MLISKNLYVYIIYIGDTLNGIYIYIYIDRLLYIYILDMLHIYVQLYAE